MVGKLTLLFKVWKVSLDSRASNDPLFMAVGGGGGGLFQGSGLKGLGFGIRVFRGETYLRFSVRIRADYAFWKVVSQWAGCFVLGSVVPSFCVLV